MSEIFEVAYAAATNRLCFFTGTGFSKSVTNNRAPSWQGLLKSLCDLLPDADELKESLFPDDKPSPLSLEEVVTTNYDKLAEELTGESECQSLAPGLPIPRSSADVKVYHVHGSTDLPDNMVIISEDYFKFINGAHIFLEN